MMAEMENVRTATELRPTMRLDQGAQTFYG